MIWFWWASKLILLLHICTMIYVLYGILWRRNKFHVFVKDHHKIVNIYIFVITVKHVRVEIQDSVMSIFFFILSSSKFVFGIDRWKRFRLRRSFKSLSSTKWSGCGILKPKWFRFCPVHFKLTENFQVLVRNFSISKEIMSEPLDKVVVSWLAELLLLLLTFDDLSFFG